MDKEATIQEALKEREEQAEKAFKNRVNEALREVCTLSESLRRAKERLLELEYEPPEKPDLDF